MKDKEYLTFLKKECIAAGFDVQGDSVWAYNREFPITSPLAIHLKTYRTDPSHETRYTAMKNAFDTLWPKHSLTYNYWTERVFREHCDHSTEVFTLAGGGGIGKALKHGTLVHTPSGLIPIENLKVNDVIYSTTGEFQTVTGVYPQGIRPLYRVRLSDGTYADVDEDHLWSVSTRQPHRKISTPATLTTKEMLANPDKRYFLPFYAPIPAPHKDLPLHPYILGLFLSRRPMVRLFNDITENKRLRSLVLAIAPKNVPLFEWYKDLFVKFKLISPEHKRIPAEYLTASIPQRVALIQGIFDLDANVTAKGHIKYSVSAPALMQGVVSVLRSLGFIVPVIKSHKSKAGLLATILRTPETTNIPLFADEHLACLDSKLRSAYLPRHIASITPIPAGPATCIKVSHPNSLFLVNDFIPTHNTQTAAYVGALFWLALPNQRAVIVTSTTVESLQARIYGYILRLIRESAYPLQVKIKTSPPPCVYPIPPDYIHGIFGIAAKQGSDEKAIQDIIGRHPKNALMLILDEAPDMPIAIMNAMPNLKKGLEDRFQCIAIGNPKSTFDLHGILSTPINGWHTVDPNKDFKWTTTQAHGTALYFNPYDSPAIHETDPVKKQALSKFLVTEHKLKLAEDKEGKDSESFWRFTMGFWKSRSTDNTLISESFLKDFDPTHTAEFSGRHPIHYVAGLDPAFTTGGDKCVLRLAVLGHHVDGSIVLDYRKEDLLFIVPIIAKSDTSPEIQIADYVLKILTHYNIPLHHLCVDASGQGRALADVLYLRAGNSSLPPTKILSHASSGRKSHHANFMSPGLYTSSSHDLWFTGREFIQNRQIFGLDKITYGQLYTRLLVETARGVQLLEKKHDYKKRMAAISSVFGSSPDEADAAMLTLQSAILHHGFFPGQKHLIDFSESDTHRQFAEALQAYKATMPAIHHPVSTPKFTSTFSAFVRHKR